MSEITEHQKELDRRKTLTNPERAQLAKEDSEKAWQKKVAAAGRVEGMIKDRDKLALAVQEDIAAFAEKLNKLTNMHLKIYQCLINPDSNLDDCPISNGMTYYWMRQYMMKVDMDWINEMALDGKPAIPMFADKIIESSKWIRRFIKTPEKDKTGIDSIL